MSDRYTLRETAVVDYLEGVLSSDYLVTRSVSYAMAHGSQPYVVLVRWTGFAPTPDNTNRPSTDRQTFSLVLLPRASGDDRMNDACNVMAEAVTDAIRNVSSFSVLDDITGQPLGWIVSTGRKGENQGGQTVIELTVEVDIQETVNAPDAAIVLSLPERASTAVTASVEGLDAGEFVWKKGDGTEDVAASIAYTGSASGTTRLRVYDAADLTKLERVKLEVKGPTAASKTVPDCATLDEAAANLAITAAGLTPDSDGAFSNTVAKGIVINQSPAAGASAYAGDIVTITVSFGVEYKIVPVVAGLTEAAAAAALVAAGLIVGTSTTSMTNDTAAGLVSDSSPAAGTGVVAGSAVNLTVSLGDLHTRIPVNVAPGRTANILVTTTGGATFYWLKPDGSTAAGASGVYYSSYTAPLGATDAIIYCVMNAGYTTSQIIGFEGESGTNGARFCLDYLKHIRVSAAQRLWLNSPFGGVYGDIANLASSLVAGSTIYLNVQYAQDGIYGDLSALPPLLLYNCYYWTRVYGALTPHSTCAIIRMLNVYGPSFADISQTIINWNAANAASFARTGIFNLYKRSQLTAAGEAAVVALIAKGCTFTFAAP